MDFPLDLDKLAVGQGPVTVLGYEELKQTLWLVLKNVATTFCQSPVLGSYVGIHSEDEEVLLESCIYTIEQLRGLKVKDINKTGEYINITVQYYDRLSKFEFNINESL